MNAKIDLNEIMGKYGIKPGVMAEVMFPGAKHPKRALDRLIKGEQAIDMEQLRKLAFYIGVPMQDLLSSKTWAGTTEDGCITFRKENYKAKLNYRNVFLSIYRDDALVLQEFGSMGNMTLNEFIEYLDLTVKKLNNGSN